MAWKAITATVIAGVLVAVLGAAALGGGSQMMNRVTDLLKPQPPAGVYGTWTFDHYAGDSPDDFLTGSTGQFNTLLLRDDETYTATGRFMFPGGASMAFNQSGTFEMRDADSVRFHPDQKDGLQSSTLDITVRGDELRLFDAAEGVIYVFQRG